MRHQFAVDIDAAAVDRVVGRDDVLQGCLQYFVRIRRGQRRITVQVGERIAVGVLGIGAQQEVIVVQSLLQREVARIGCPAE